MDTGFQQDYYVGVLEPPLGEGFLPQNDFVVDDSSFVEPHSEPAVDDYESENFPEAAFAEGEEHADDYTPEEWAAWEAGAYESFEDGGAREEFVEHFSEYDDAEFYSDDY